MAQQPEYNRGSWLLAEELLERGDPAFVDELRRIGDADKLAAFAARWYADPRPQARQLMFAYLAQPLNAFRHEPLVKRLFKYAEKNGDDELLAHFLVAFDRCIRRALIGGTHIRSWPDSAISREGNELRYYDYKQHTTVPWWTAKQHEGKRLFSLETRKYLRRRVWRYFRELGSKHSDRYVSAVVTALLQYTDEDVRDGVALLDNWSLVHILFDDSGSPRDEVIVPRVNGWQLADDRNLAELTAAPRYETIWKKSAEPLLPLLRQARCRAVRQWTLQMLEAHHPRALANLPLAELLQLVADPDPLVAQLALAALRASPQLGYLQVDQWLQLLEDANTELLDVLTELLVEKLDANAVTIAQAVKLAIARPLPIARVGLQWLQTKRPATATECELLLSLAEMEAEPLRGPAITWLHGVLSASSHFQPRWILDLLDSRHADVRAEAWKWFLNEPRGAHDVSLWQRLLESPYDDIRLQLVGHLEHGTKNVIAVDRSQFNPELIRFLWASVLLNIHRGNRHKPVVVSQIVNRLAQRPQEAGELLPIISVALRSIRGPEFRSGLAGVVRLLEASPELSGVVKSSFPELQVF